MRNEENEDDYRYSEEARQRDFQVIWKCDSCGKERRDYPGVNEGGQCSCGGTFCEAGESYCSTGDNV